MFSVTITVVNGETHAVEVSQEVYDFLMQDKKNIRNHQRWNERHIEASELSEEQLYSRVHFKKF
ncbi:MAG: hypothetical protein RR444_09015 [Oscillospiraceae bacterium]